MMSAPAGAQQHGALRLRSCGRQAGAVALAKCISSYLDRRSDAPLDGPAADPASDGRSWPEPPSPVRPWRWAGATLAIRTEPKFYPAHPSLWRICPTREQHRDCPGLGLVLPGYRVALCVALDLNQACVNIAGWPAGAQTWFVADWTTALSSITIPIVAGL